MAVPLKGAFLQSNLNADNWGIDNLDITSLGLTKSSVGLGNVDNTSDANKPVSTATAAALALKEPLVTPGTTSQFWRGDKTWTNYGALALQDGTTTLPLLSSIGPDASSGASIQARRSDFGSSGVKTEILHGGASQLGSILGGGIPSANAGALVFTGAARGVIKTTNNSPLYFGTNSLLRMQLLLGLNVGGTTDPGQGCISALFDISAGRDLSCTGDLLVSGALAHVEGDLQVDGDIISSGDFSAATVFASDVTAQSRLFVPSNPPANAGATGVTGQITWDATHLYVCVNTNTWVRTSLATWP